MDALAALRVMADGLVRLGYTGRVILACALCHLPIWVVAAIRPLSRRTPLLAMFAGFSAIGTVGGGLSLIASSRNGVVRAIGMREPASEIAHLYAASVDRGETGGLLAAWGLLVMAALGSVAAARAALRRGEGQAPSAAVVSLLALSLALGGTLLARAIQLSRWYLATSASSDDLVDVFLRTSSRVHAQSMGLVALAGVIAATLVALSLWASRGRAEEPTRRQALGAAALFGLGFVAFVATRAHAQDARAPLDPDPRRSLVWPSLMPGALPVIAGCKVMEYGEEGPPVDLRLLEQDRFGQLPAPAVMAAELGRRVELYRSVRKGHPIPPILLLAAPDMAPSPRSQAYLEMARDVWTEGAAIAVLPPPRTSMSRTLGAIPRARPLCLARIRWAPGGKSLSSFATWQEAASAVAASPDAGFTP